ncbi:MAG: hypothetical protein AAF411_23855, partial [Myxococcota bacterium]
MQFISRHLLALLAFVVLGPACHKSSLGESGQLLVVEQDGARFTLLEVNAETRREITVIDTSPDSVVGVLPNPQGTHALLSFDRPFGQPGAPQSLLVDIETGDIDDVTTELIDVPPEFGCTGSLGGRPFQGADWLSSGTAFIYGCGAFVDGSVPTTFSSVYFLDGGVRVFEPDTIFTALTDGSFLAFSGGEARRVECESASVCAEEVLERDGNRVPWLLVDDSFVEVEYVDTAERVYRRVWRRGEATPLFEPTSGGAASNAGSSVIGGSRSGSFSVFEYAVTDDSASGRFQRIGANGNREDIVDCEPLTPNR